MKNILTTKVSIIYFVFLTSIAVFCTFLITASYFKLHKSKSSFTAGVEDLKSSNSCNNIQFKRLNGYTLIKPLLFADKSCESGAFSSLKQSVEGIINTYKVAGDLSTASVYVRDFNEGDFMDINSEEKFKLGTLMKIPVLVSYLRDEEDNPGSFEKELQISSNEKLKHSLHENKMQVGRKYKIKQLLELMMINDDENATQLLYENINLKAFKKTFSDIGIPEPVSCSDSISISAANYSLFMRTLYNATYLTINDSEYAIELLVKSNATQNIYKDLSTSTRIAHKSSAEETVEGKVQNETSIIYLKDTPYLITIMTKGKDNDKLSKAISKISAAVYNEMAYKS